MFVHRKLVEWGECDAAGVVFYPRYLEYCDEAFQAFLRSRQLSQRDLMARYAVVGTPIVECGATFVRPVSYGSELLMSVDFSLLGPKRFRADYGLRVGEEDVARAFEIRAFVQRGEDGIMRSISIPDEFASCLQLTVPPSPR